MISDFCLFHHASFLQSADIFVDNAEASDFGRLCGEEKLAVYRECAILGREKTTDNLLFWFQCLGVKYLTLRGHSASLGWESMARGK